ncbi:MAG TPA: hypothetical protein VGD11_17775 [Mycobacteriales bacterium]
MIICGVCGAHNDEGVAFCGSCGTYLGFAGEPADQPEQGRPGAAADTASSGKGTPPATPAAAPANSTPTPAANSAASDVVPLVVPVEASRGAGEAAPPRPPQPPPAPEGGATAEPVRPGAPSPRRRPAELPPEQREAQPGELICGHCGAGNVPTRGFCRRCGAVLADAPVVPPPPWWRRWLRRDRDGEPKAGYRPRRVVRRAYRGKVAFLVVLGLLGAAGWVYWPALNRMAATLVDRRSETSPVEPARLTASSWVPGHLPGLVLDNKTNTFWAPSGRREGRGQYLDVRFAEPFRLVAVVLFNGASARGPEYRAEGRPHTLRFTFTSPGAAATSREVVLKDVPGQQNLYMGVDDVSRVRVTIVDSVGGGPGRLVALAELEFRRRA